jgi:hypothetical protein
MSDVTLQELRIRLPDWVPSIAARIGAIVLVEDRMRVAIGLARMNVERSTGGPFGAAVFDRDTGALI